MDRLKKLHGKPWHQVAVFGTLAVMLFLVFYTFVTKPVREETVTLNEQIESLKQENEKARFAAQRINEVRALHAQRRIEYEELKALLPEQRELTTVLAGLQDRAYGRLSVRRFTPRPDEVAKEGFYSAKPIEVEISGSYNNLGAFFADMAQYQRIVSISDFKINTNAAQVGGRTIDAQFLLTAYYVSPEKLQQALPNGKPAPAAPAAPAAAAATTPAAPAAASSAPASAALTSPSSGKMSF